MPVGILHMWSKRAKTFVDVNLCRDCSTTPPLHSPARFPEVAGTVLNSIKPFSPVYGWVAIKL